VEGRQTWRIPKLSAVGTFAWCGCWTYIAEDMVAEHIGWPCVFWIVSAFDGALLVLYTIFVQESYTPVLLAKASTLWRHTRNDYHIKVDSTLSKKFRTSFLRPLKLLVTRPIMLEMSFLMDIILEHIASLFDFCKNLDKTLPSVRDCKRSASYSHWDWLDNCNASRWPSD
jgi:lipid-A-disaccharide synthase-like uncharacterized protein